MKQELQIRWVIDQRDHLNGGWLFDVAGDYATRSEAVDAALLIRPRVTLNDVHFRTVARMCTVPD